ncbi:hypothetical protein ACK5MC_004852, partial [Klebsiella pneumoniae]
MGEYNTGNPVPSTDMRDVFDNSQNLDFSLNDITSSIWTDRLGRPRMSWFGIESAFELRLAEQESKFNIDQLIRSNDFDKFLENKNSIFISQFNQQAQEFDAQLTSQESRYEIVLQQAGKTVLGRYEDGPWTLTSYNQLVSHAGTFWKLAASVAIGSGYTTAGTTESTWNATDKANFVDVGQDQLRSELGAIFMPGPSGNSTTDTQLLQAALSVRGMILYNKPGEYFYNGTGTISSGTSFHTASGVRWIQDKNAETWSPLLVNEALNASKYVVTSMT